MIRRVLLLLLPVFIIYLLLFITLNTSNNPFDYVTLAYISLMILVCAPAPPRPALT
jgi:hypothetical protein